MSITESLARLLRRMADSLGARAVETGDNGRLLDEYIAGPPSAQNAVDCLEGWNTALPAKVGAKAGHAAFYNDPRILWALEQYGPIEDKRILELGPLEASHTYMLEQRRPRLIHAIEANKLSFLRCLVVKELLGLSIAKFMLGDFVAWLRQRQDRYDLIVASGVLYHMVDPIELLELMAARTDAMFLWTHYASDAAMGEGDPRRMAFVGEPEAHESHGVMVRMRKRSYWGAWKDKSFCGGMHDLHRWIEKDDILKLIGALGFDDVRTAFDDPGHQNGPSFAIFARRTKRL